MVAGLEADEDGGADVSGDVVAACLVAKRKLIPAIKRNSANRTTSGFKWEPPWFEFSESLRPEKLIDKFVFFVKKTGLHGCEARVIRA